MTDRIHVSYFSDVLCVWAYVAQIRLDELQKQHGPNIEVSYHFIPILGSTEHRIGEGWKKRGGFEGYAAHVAEICADFPHVDLSPDAWTTVRPTSSAPGHQFLKAVQLLEADSVISAEPVDELSGRSLVEEAAWRIRLAFFQDGKDVSRFEVLWGLAADLGLPVRALKEEFDNTTDARSSTATSAIRSSKRTSKRYFAARPRPRPGANRFVYCAPRSIRTQGCLLRPSQHPIAGLSTAPLAAFDRRSRLWLRRHGPSCDEVGSRAPRRGTPTARRAHRDSATPRPGRPSG